MLGFRVVAIPEPGTISLMSLSTVGLFLTRTVRRRKRLGISLVPIRRQHLCDTFGSEREWNAGKTHEDEDYIAMLSDVLKQNMQDFWHRLTGYCGSLDRAFWNRMVLAHERKVERRIAFRATMRKKALNGLDRFLAMIMK